MHRRGCARDLGLSSKGVESHRAASLRHGQDGRMQTALLDFPETAHTNATWVSRSNQGQLREGIPRRSYTLRRDEKKSEKEPFAEVHALVDEAAGGKGGTTARRGSRETRRNVRLSALRGKKTLDADVCGKVPGKGERAKRASLSGEAREDAQRRKSGKLQVLRPCLSTRRPQKDGENGSCDW